MEECKFTCKKCNGKGNVIKASSLYLCLLPSVNNSGLIFASFQYQATAEEIESNKQAGYIVLEIKHNSSDEYFEIIDAIQK